MNDVALDTGMLYRVLLMGKQTPYQHSHTYIRNLNPAGYRSGQWGTLKGVSIISLPAPEGEQRTVYEPGYWRLVFDVEFVDGSTDQWAVFDPDGQYEFAPYLGNGSLGSKV